MTNNNTDCKHSAFYFHIEASNLCDIGVIMVELAANCVKCGQPLSFPSLPFGISTDCATRNVDGTNISIPAIVGEIPVDTENPQTCMVHVPSTKPQG